MTADGETGEVRCGNADMPRPPVGPPLLYLYGVVRAESPERLVAGAGLDGGGVVFAIRLGDLAAVVSLVSALDFGSDVLPSQLRDPEWLERIVRGHQRVVEAVHRERTILPTRFGSVFAQQADLVAALARNQDVLAAQLALADGCDEWSVQIQAERSAIESRAASDQPAVAQLAAEIASARPGRAYFLTHRKAMLMSRLADEEEEELSRQLLRLLTRCTVAARVTPAPDRGRYRALLRAAFLVRRTEFDVFLAEIHQCVGSVPGLSCEYSGPWPPYTFATLAAGSPG